MSETTISLMREKLVIPEAEEIEIVNRKKPDVSPDEFVPFQAPEDQAPPLPSFGDGYRILHSLNPHDEKGGIAWDPDVYEKLYHRITNKIRANYDDIVRVEDGNGCVYTQNKYDPDNLFRLNANIKPSQARVNG